MPGIFQCSVAALLLTLSSVFTIPVGAFEIKSRLGRTATDGSTGSRGDPITVTWGIVPDGTLLTRDTPHPSSNLINMLDTNLGAGPGGSDLTLRPWYSIFDDAFARITELSGVTYVYEPKDSGQSIPQQMGSLGVNADIRIGGNDLGPGWVGYNYYPDYSDMVLNTGNVGWFSDSANNFRRFRNSVMHETGHGLGLNHVDSNNASFLMEGGVGTSFDGPQLDDILALHRNYGDALEKGSGNNTSATSTSLGSVTPGGMLRIGRYGDSAIFKADQKDFLSIDDNSDVDYFSFTLPREVKVRLNLTPRGATYNAGPQGGTQVSLNTKALSNLALDLFGPNGASILESANNTPIGGSETIVRTLPAGTYFSRVTGADSNVQLYGLNIKAYAGDLLPDTMITNGSFETQVVGESGSGDPPSPGGWYFPQGWVNLKNDAYQVEPDRWVTAKDGDQFLMMNPEEGSRQVRTSANSALEANQIYTFTVWALQPDWTGADWPETTFRLQMDWAGGEIQSSYTLPADDHNWIAYTLELDTNPGGNGFSAIGQLINVEVQGNRGGRDFALDAFSLTAAIVPEPSSLIMLAIAAIGLLSLGRRRRWR